MKQISFDLTDFKKIRFLNIDYNSFDPEYYDREYCAFEESTGNIYYIKDRKDGIYDAEHPLIKELLCKGNIEYDGLIDSFHLKGKLTFGPKLELLINGEPLYPLIYNRLRFGEGFDLDIEVRSKPLIR